MMGEKKNEYALEGRVVQVSLDLCDTGVPGEHSIN